MSIDLLDSLTLTRPLWLLLLIPGAVLCWLLYQRINHYSPWHNLLPAAMRDALLQRQPGRAHAGRFVLLGAAWALAILTLSGPVWESKSTVVRQNQSALVVVLDLSHNMLANDISPTRLERARLKIRDLLQIRSDTQVALIAFAGSAHRVTPLTTDQSTLINLLEGLSPDIMPVSGADLGSALELAEQMIAPLPPEGTQILLITGSVEDAQLQTLSQSAERLGRQLSILGAGTVEGAPVALPEGGFMRDNQGRIVLPRLDKQTLAAIARRTGASYHDITRDDTDLLSLLQPLALTRLSDPDRSPRQTDQGHWLLLLLLPLAALGARRGWLGLLLCALLLPTSAEADPDWQDLWQRPDQQAAELLLRDQPAAAATRFENPEWAAWALYQAGDYPAAAKAYEQLIERDPDNPKHHFDHGTALAMGGELEDALEAYEQTLTRAPDHAAARHNRSRIEALIEERKRQSAQQETGTADSVSDAENDDSRSGSEKPANGPVSQSKEVSGSEPQTDPSPSPSAATTPAADTATAAPQPTQSGQRNENAAGLGTNGEASMVDSGQNRAVLGPPASEVLQDSNRPLPQLADPLQKTLDPEQQTALQQWLREIPDNPADLLRRKFLYQRLQQLEEGSR